jgi:alkanesulfonate monooxygenase
VSRGQRVGGYGGRSFLRTQAIADPTEVSIDRVIPELQRREILRKEYEGRTPRENLGLPRPKNRFFKA